MGKGESYVSGMTHAMYPFLLVSVGNLCPTGRPTQCHLPKGSRGRRGLSTQNQGKVKRGKQELEFRRSWSWVLSWICFISHHLEFDNSICWPL